MIRSSKPNPTRQDRYVVMKPPSSGPTAAAIPADAPTSAYALRCIGPEKLPWIQGLHSGRSSDAPRPPDHGPEDDHREQALGQRHRQGPAA